MKTCIASNIWNDIRNWLANNKVNIEFPYFIELIVWKRHEHPYASFWPWNPSSKSDDEHDFRTKSNQRADNETTSHITVNDTTHTILMWFKRVACVCRVANLPVILMKASEKLQSTFVVELIGIYSRLFLVCVFFTFTNIYYYDETVCFVHRDTLLFDFGCCAKVLQRKGKTRRKWKSESLKFK